MITTSCQSTSLPLLLHVHQGQADDVEQALALLRFQLEDLLAEVHWVLGDLANDEDGAGR